MNPAPVRQSKFYRNYKFVITGFVAILFALTASSNQAVNANIQHNNTMKDAKTDYASPPLEVKMTESERERFWSRIDKNGPIQPHVPHLGQCWVYTGGKFTEGYGAFHFRGRNQFAHRIAYVDMFGAIPEGMLIMHECDNPCCVRHLRLGTQKDNLDDMRSKNRQVYTGAKNPARGEGHWSRLPKNESAKERWLARMKEPRSPEEILKISGENSHRAKLNEKEVREIRQLSSGGKRMVDIASEFRVSVYTVSDIVNRRSWRHIT